MQLAKLHLGLSGYDYRDWQGEGLFYPPSLRRADYLEHYATRMNSLESLGTFRRNPTEAMVAKWIASTPDDFTFSPRMIQSVTHFMRLSGNAVSAAQRFLSLLEPLEPFGKLGVVSLQIPEDLGRNEKLLATFLDAMPRRPELRWSIEFRNETWNVGEVEALLRDRNVAWIAAEFDEAPVQIRDTASFVYVRLRRLSYSDEQLQAWAGFLSERLRNGVDCYVYCRHLDTVAPWIWADRLKELVDVG
jgi:uncharacterized protein YecE (DUF72 family)